MKHKILAILAFLVALSGLAEAHYNPAKGRFMSRDPIEEKGGVNVYAFVRNDVINKWDRYGLCEKKDNIVTDAAGRKCCACEITVVEFRVKSPETPILEQLKPAFKKAEVTIFDFIKNREEAIEAVIPHVEVEKIDHGHSYLYYVPTKTERGFTGDGREFTMEVIGGNKKGKVKSENGTYTHSKKYNMCTKTKNLLFKAVKKSENDPPFYYFADLKPGGPKEQCNTWALSMLKEAGIEEELTFPPTPCQQAQAEGFVKK